MSLSLLLNIIAGHQVVNILARKLPDTVNFTCHLPEASTKECAGMGVTLLISLHNSTQGIRENYNLEFHIQVNNMKLGKQALHFGSGGLHAPPMVVDGSLAGHC